MKAYLFVFPTPITMSSPEHVLKKYLGNKEMKMTYTARGRERAQSPPGNSEELQHPSLIHPLYPDRSRPERAEGERWGPIIEPAA